jgi:hypothetical protein
MKTSHEEKFNRYTFTVLRSRLKPFHDSRITSHKSLPMLRDTNSSFATGFQGLYLQTLT